MTALDLFSCAFNAEDAIFLLTYGFTCYTNLIRNTSISVFLVALGNRFTATDICSREIVVFNILLAKFSNDASYYYNYPHMLVT